jgi:hypothetical protein
MKQSAFSKMVELLDISRKAKKEKIKAKKSVTNKIEPKSEKTDLKPQLKE